MIKKERRYSYGKANFSYFSSPRANNSESLSEEFLRGAMEKGIQ